MAICNDFSAWQHTTVHCCHNYTEHHGLETGYCLTLSDLLLSYFFLLSPFVSIAVILRSLISEVL